MLASVFISVLTPFAAYITTVIDIVGSHSSGKLRKTMALSNPEKPTMMGIGFGIVGMDLGSA
jgi:hypothetical protein